MPSSEPRRTPRAASGPARPISLHPAVARWIAEQRRHQRRTEPLLTGGRLGAQRTKTV